ncbi:MAG: plasmid recombination protein [Oscillospiraceae bacterium]|nr:plasmid recombination protein [Oscillospiraceae bacterium]
MKKDSPIFNELIFDVNTQYFYQNGGYEFAKKFYEAAFHFAEELYGNEYILSAVMHADEVNLGLSDEFNTYYHYHMHVMALPVVEKEVRWTKRCKDKSLVGKVKRIEMQVSHSKKWYSEKIVDENGKTYYNYSYSILQDKFWEYMQNAGFRNFERGEKGSTAEHLSSLQHQIEKDKRRLLEAEYEAQKAEKALAEIKPIQIETEQIDEIGKKNILGKIQMSAEDYEKLTTLAKEGIANRYEIAKQKSVIEQKNDKISFLEDELNELKKKCKPFLEALKIAPKKVMKFIEEIIKPPEKAVQKAEEDKPSQWETTIGPKKPPQQEVKHEQPKRNKKKGDYER